MTLTVTPTQTILHALNPNSAHPLAWQGPLESLCYHAEEIHAALLETQRPVYVLLHQGQVVATHEGEVVPARFSQDGLPALAPLPALPIEQLGDPAFRTCYGLKYALYGGAMANGIASESMVVALGQAGMMGSFGAAGCSPARVEAAIQRIQSELPEGPYAFNLIHSPNEPSLEGRVVELYLKHGVTVVEASAFLALTPTIVQYRAAGLSLDPDGKIRIKNRVIVKLSRKEVAVHFLQPAPVEMLSQLVAEGRITAEQSALAQRIPVADDITVEADSGGHTDNRPLVCLVPTMLALRDEIQARQQYEQPVRVGAAGGISTPSAALAALMMGAAYVATGSVNQACVEAGTCEYVKNQLAKASMADVMMAPSADMFEMGVKVQLLKTGTLFPMRAQKLYELYTKYNSIEEIPVEERTRLEQQILKRPPEQIWQDTVKFFLERDPQQIERAKDNPKRIMALIFRWYLGLSSRWAVAGEKGREMDYQIWCGPAMGTFNDWTRGTYLETPSNRRVADVALHLLSGAAYLYRIQQLKLQGMQLVSELEQYHPQRPLV